MSNEELVAAIQAGAPERMGELWEQVAGLVKWKANRMMTALSLGGNPRGVEFDDLYQSGYPAMVKAVETYDPAAGAFSTWFGYYLKTAFAECTGCRTKKGFREPLDNALSIDKPITDETDSSLLGDFIPDKRATATMEAVEDKVWREQLCEAVDTAMLRIPEEQREVLRLRFWDNLTLEEVGQRKGFGKEYARQLENKGIRQLRQPRNACHLKPFYDFNFYCHSSLGAFQQTGMSIQERYLVIEEERKEREAEKRRQEDEELKRRLEESRKWFAEYRARQEAKQREKEELISQLTPEEKRALLEKYGYA